MPEKSNAGFWVILEDAEGRVLQYWWTRMERGLPFGARIRLSTTPPSGINEETQHAR